MFPAQMYDHSSCFWTSSCHIRLSTVSGSRNPCCSTSFVSAIFLRQNAMLMKMSFICFFEYGTLQSPCHPHGPVPVHIEEFSMTFQDRHETGLHEGLVNIALNGQAFETHGRRPRICSLSSLSYISYNRSVLNINLVFCISFFRLWANPVVHVPHL